MSQADPLNGATLLCAQEALSERAHALAAEAARKVVVRISPNAFPGRIYGFKARRYQPVFTYIEPEESK